MKKIIISIVLILITELIFPQTEFSLGIYNEILKLNKDLTSNDLYKRNDLSYKYILDLKDEYNIQDASYLDSLQIKFGLTDDELELIEKNGFVVSERMSYPTFFEAFKTIFENDMPIFISTDAILHALHASYDDILISIEKEILIPNLQDVLKCMYNNFIQLKNKYSDNIDLIEALKDVDLYVTIAKSLIIGSKQSPNLKIYTEINSIWNAIQSYQYIEMPLFSSGSRRLDFSQFIPRGHYTESKELENYFKCMMWLGRIDFLLTLPEYLSPLPEKDIQRMHLGAYMLNKLIELLGEKKNLLEKNDEIIQFMVGESDNITIDEYAKALKIAKINEVTDLLDFKKYESFKSILSAQPEYGQKLLSNVIMSDPFSSVPSKLPVSFRLMGQRFTIDSYIFSNVVYDKIIYNNKKVMRMMPDPLDIMFVLGNKNAAPLLQEELEKYPYSCQLENLKYLVNSYDSVFWSQSLYNCWLSTLRSLNKANIRNYPSFMQTIAWQQEKLNTQLASWSQLRRDNILYVKQSYSFGATCSYPDGFVEPYPEFYNTLAEFGQKAKEYFSPINKWISDYFGNMSCLMDTLSLIAQKELKEEELSKEDIKFIKRVAFNKEYVPCSGSPENGWYSSLFYINERQYLTDYIIADVHTQVTDEDGYLIGKVLHVGVGKINLGVFIANSPAPGFKKTAYIGPVMSYYKTITENFERMTDQDWTFKVESRNLPERPDWVNIYLADSNGNKRNKGAELSDVFEFKSFPLSTESVNINYSTDITCYPNPIENILTTSGIVSENQTLLISLFDIYGRKIFEIENDNTSTDYYNQSFDFSYIPAGLYVLKIKIGESIKSFKIIKK